MLVEALQLSILLVSLLSPKDWKPGEGGRGGSKPGCRAAIRIRGLGLGHPGARDAV